MLKNRKLTALFMVLILGFLMSINSGALMNEAGAGETELDGIMIVKLPNAEDGTLVYNGHTMLSGEAVPAEYFELLEYIPSGSENSAYSYIPVYKDGTIGEETICEVSAAGMSDETPGKVNRKPTAGNMEITTYSNLTVSGILPVSDDGYNYTCQILTAPSGGMVTVEGNTFVYCPYQNRTGADSFTYIVRDENGAWSEECTVTVEVEKQKSGMVYSDMAGNPSEYAAVKLAEEGIYIGKCVGGKIYFEPDELVTRGEFIAMAMAASGYESRAAASTFFSDDENISEWTRSYVAAAVREGIVSGDTSGGEGTLLRADSYITRAEAAVIINNAGSFTGVNSSPGFTDAENVPDWAAAALARLESNGIYSVTGGGYINADVVMTRAEVAEVLLNLLNYNKNSAVEAGFFSWTTVK